MCKYNIRSVSSVSVSSCKQNCLIIKKKKCIYVCQHLVKPEISLKRNPVSGISVQQGLYLAPCAHAPSVNII